MHLAGFYIHVDCAHFPYIALRSEREDYRHAPADTLGHYKRWSASVHHVTDVAQHKAVDLLSGGISGDIYIRSHSDIYFKVSCLR